MTDWKVCKYKFPYAENYRFNKEACIFIAQSMTCRPSDGWTLDSEFLSGGKISPKVYCEYSTGSKSLPKEDRTRGYFILLTHKDGSHFAFGASFGTFDRLYFGETAPDIFRYYNNTKLQLKEYSAEASILPSLETQEGNARSYVSIWCAYAPPEAGVSPFNANFGMQKKPCAWNELVPLYSNPGADHIGFFPLSYQCLRNSQTYDVSCKHVSRISENDGKYFSDDINGRSPNLDKLKTDNNRFILMIKGENLILLNFWEAANTKFTAFIGGKLLQDNDSFKYINMLSFNRGSSELQLAYNFFADNIYFYGSNRYCAYPPSNYNSSSTFACNYSETPIRTILQSQEIVPINATDLLKYSTNTIVPSLIFQIADTAQNFYSDKEYDLTFVCVKRHSIRTRFLKYYTNDLSSNTIPEDLSKLKFIGGLLKRDIDFIVLNESNTSIEVKLIEPAVSPFPFKYSYRNKKSKYVVADVVFNSDGIAVISPADGFSSSTMNGVLFVPTREESVFFFKKENKKTIYVNAENDFSCSYPLVGISTTNTILFTVLTQNVFAYIYNFNGEEAFGDFNRSSLSGQTTSRIRRVYYPAYSGEPQAAGMYPFIDPERLSDNMQYSINSAFPWSRVYIGFNNGITSESKILGYLDDSSIRITHANNELTRKQGTFFDNKKFVCVADGVLFPWDGQSDFFGAEESPINSSNKK